MVIDNSKEDQRWNPAYGEPRGQSAPECPFCYNQVRRENAKRKPSFHTLGNTPPWNAGWDGICDNCGHKFEKVVEKQLHFSVKRKASFHPTVIPYRTFVDEAVILCGVEIVIDDNQFREEPKVTSIKLTMNELEILFASLKDELNICHEQYGWSEDWT